MVNIFKKVIKKIRPSSYISHQDFLWAIWKITKNYYKFKLISYLVSSLSFIIYVASGLAASLLVLFSISPYSKPVYLWLSIPLIIILIYIAIFALSLAEKNIIRKGALLVFNLNRIKKSKNEAILKEAISCFGNELPKVYKRKRKIINMLNIFTANFLLSADLKPILKDIKQNFKIIEISIIENNLTGLLQPIKNINEKIKNTQKYKNIQEYVKVTMDIKTDKSIISYLFQIHKKQDQKKVMHTIYEKIDGFFGFLNKHFKVVIAIIIISFAIYLWLYHREFFMGFMNILIKSRTSTPAPL